MKLTRTAVHATHSWVNNDRPLADFTAALETGACNSKDGFLCLPELGERLVRRRFRAESYGDNWGSGGFWLDANPGTEPKGRYFS